MTRRTNGFEKRGEPRAQFTFDTRPILDELGDIPLTEPEVLAYLRETIAGGISQAQAAFGESNN